MNKKAKEILFVILLVTGMLGSGVVVGFMGGGWFLLGVFVIFFLCFGLMEWLAVKKTGKSISQQFWAFGEKHPIMKWVVITALIVAWLSLMWHFGAH